MRKTKWKMSVNQLCVHPLQHGKLLPLHHSFLAYKMAQHTAWAKASAPPPQDRKDYKTPPSTVGFCFCWAQDHKEVFLCTSER